jgi:hypothetical protein
MRKRHEIFEVEVELTSQAVLRYMHLNLEQIFIISFDFMHGKKYQIHHCTIGINTEVLLWHKRPYVDIAPMNLKTS